MKPTINFNHNQIMNNHTELTTKIEKIIQMGEKVLATETKGFQQQTFVNEQQFHDFRISGLSFLSRVFNNNSQYYQSFKTEVTSPGTSRTKRGLGILLAAGKDLKGDWLETTRGAITSEILTEFMAMAKSHIEMGNLTSSTVLIGAVIEKYLRNLCSANNIVVTNKQSKAPALKKPLQLTGEAYKKKLYDRQQHKKIISWLELCDSAAQTPPAEVSIKEIETMYTDVTRFISDTHY